MLGTMLVIVHGLGRDASEWKAWDGDDVLVPDLPELRRTDARPDFARAIAHVLARLDHDGIPHAAWIGHSGGAHLVLELADRHPERVERLVLVAAAPPRVTLDRVRCPILVVLGARDALRVDPRPHVRVEVMPGVGHDPHLERPDQLRALIARWAVDVPHR